MLSYLFRKTQFLLKSEIFKFLNNHLTFKQIILSIYLILMRIIQILIIRLNLKIQPNPNIVEISLTSNCNLRCKCCKYGRDFMARKNLNLKLVKRILESINQNSISQVRLYGGEPTIHPDIVKIAQYSIQLGLDTYISTNGINLRNKVDELLQAGIKRYSIGLYGFKETYDEYVQIKGSYFKLIESLDYIKKKYGTEIEISIGFLLTKKNCNDKTILNLYKFVKKYQYPILINLIHYSFPYFTNDEEFQFYIEDFEQIQRFTRKLILLKKKFPKYISGSFEALASIPDWLIKKKKMKLPCDKSKLIWIGPDGSVQLCRVTFLLGNIYKKDLSDLLFTPQHKQFSNDCIRLKCPNCHCGYYNRIDRSIKMKRYYHRQLRSIFFNKK